MPSHRITFVFEDGHVAHVNADPGETVLDAAARQNLWLMSDCREGMCATCKARAWGGEHELASCSSEALTEDDRARGWVLTCRMYVRSNCVVELPYVSSVAMAALPQPRAARLIRLLPVSSNVLRMDLALGDGRPFHFLAGQYVHLEVPGTALVRSYSLANAPGSTGTCTFYVRLVEGGVMGKYLLERAHPGDGLQMSGPFGRFYLRPPRRPILMLAGGTGLAPMLSMLESLALSKECQAPIRLLYGANTPSELFGMQQLESYRARGLMLTYETTVVTEDPSWSGPKGHVTALLRRQHIAVGTDIYLCGPPRMIGAAETWLLAHGLAAEDVFSERFLPSNGADGQR